MTEPIDSYYLYDVRETLLLLEHGIDEKLLRHVNIVIKALLPTNEQFAAMLADIERLNAEAGS